MIPKTDPLADLDPSLADELAGMASPEEKVPDNGGGLDSILLPVKLLGPDSTMYVIDAALRMFIDATINIDPLSRAVLREKVIVKLEEIGVRSPAAMVEAAFSLIKLKQPETTGQSMAFEDCQPWPDPVDGAELLDDIVDVLKRYIVLPDKAAEAVTLWIIHTWVFEAASVSPILGIASPEKQSGKSLLQELIGALVRRPLRASNITAPALFRTVEAHQPTLLADEADTFLVDAQELRGIVNSGHTKSGAYVIRTIGDDHTPVIFRTWCPKSIALIGSLPDTIEDRSIMIRMERKTPEEKVERLRSDRIFGDLQELRRKAARWTGDHIKILKAADPLLPEELSDRGQDNWRPLIGIAEAAGGAWKGRALEAARTLSGIIADNELSIRTQLLADIRDIFQQGQETMMPSVDLVQHLVEIEEHPWGDWGRPPKNISQHQLARLLRPFGIRPRQLWTGQKVRGYHLEHFQEAFSRYIPGFRVVDPVEPAPDKGFSPFSRVVGDSVPTTSGRAVTPLLTTSLPLYHSETPKKGGTGEDMPLDSPSAESPVEEPPDDWMAPTRRFFEEKRRRDQAKREAEL